MVFMIVSFDVVEETGEEPTEDRHRTLASNKSSSRFRPSGIP